MFQRRTALLLTLLLALGAPAAHAERFNGDALNGYAYASGTSPSGLFEAGLSTIRGDLRLVSVRATSNVRVRRPAAGARVGTIAYSSSEGGTTRTLRAIRTDGRGAITLLDEDGITVVLRSRSPYRPWPLITVGGLPAGTTSMHVLLRGTVLPRCASCRPGARFTFYAVRRNARPGRA